MVEVVSPTESPFLLLNILQKTPSRLAKSITLHPAPAVSNCSGKVPFLEASPDLPSSLRRLQQPLKGLTQFLKSETLMKPAWGDPTI